MDGYWTSVRTHRLSRRVLLTSSKLGAAGLTAVAAGCGKSAPSSVAPAVTRGSGSPQTGGILNPEALYGTPPSLDPHQTSSTWAMQSVSRAVSRLFRFKTAADPKVGQDRDTESELGLSMESPDAVTWTVKMRTDAKFHNVAPVNGHPVEAEDV